MVRVADFGGRPHHAADGSGAVISDSAPWKDQLLRSSRCLDRVERQARFTDKAAFLIEREVFIGCYVTRKLFDTPKVSDSTKAMSHDVTCFPNIKSVTDLNWHRLDELYDLTSASARSISVRQLCSQVIHSFVFVAVEIENGPRGFFVASDHMREKEVWLVPIKWVIKVFRSVGADYPSRLVWQRDSDSGKITRSVG